MSTMKQGRKHIPEQRERVMHDRRTKRCRTRSDSERAALAEHEGGDEIVFDFGENEPAYCLTCYQTEAQCRCWWWWDDLEDAWSPEGPCCVSEHGCEHPAGWGGNGAYAINDRAACTDSCACCGLDVCQSDGCSRIVSFHGERVRLCLSCIETERRFA